ncbi:hypothetical protein EAE96_003862 [Botrytis aclada]|nr:hypothetical protein EAE96_003862 [Botrytis aclada]
MEADLEQSLAETAARSVWSLPEEDCLTRLIEKRKERLEDGEVPKGTLFEEVSIELNGLGFGIQRTSTACKQKWRRMRDKKSMLLAANAWQDDQDGQDLDDDFDAEHSTADEDEIDEGFNKIVDENQKRNKRVWAEEESRILYEEIKTFTELRVQEGLPKFTGPQLFNHVAQLLEVKGYVRTPRACQQYWRSTGSELWNYDERTFGDFNLLDMRNAKPTKPSSKINDRAVVEAKYPRGVLTKSQISALSQLATKSLNPSRKQQQKLAKNHGISIFQSSTYFANKRSTQKKEMAKKASDEENFKRKQSARLEAELALGNEMILGQVDDVSRDTKKRRLSITSQIAFTDYEKSTQLPSTVEEDCVPTLSASPPPSKSPRVRSPNTEFIGSNAPIEINSSPLRPTNTMEDTPSSEDEAGFKEMQEMMLVQRRRIEERIAASIDRRKQLELETIRHQIRAEMEREAAEGTQRKVEEELKVEARLRNRLDQIRSL